MKHKIIISSANRAETITTHKVLTEFSVCVPEAEADAYANTVGREHIIAHPDGLGLAQKINWCLDQQTDEALIFLDDDILGLFRCWRAAVDMESESTVTDPAFVHDVIAKTVDLASQLKAFLFGWSNSARHAVYYTGFRPFRLSGFVNGLAHGFLPGHGLRYDERIKGKGDYDISLQNALKHRYCLVDQRFAFQCKPSFVNPGAQLRTTARERETIKLLHDKWGDVVYVMSKSQGKDARLNRMGRAGVDTIALRLPF